VTELSRYLDEVGSTSGENLLLNSVQYYCSAPRTDKTHDSLVIHKLVIHVLMIQYYLRRYTWAF
jgi:hypothetical protein